MIDLLRQIDQNIIKDGGCFLSGNTPDGVIHIGAIREQLIADCLLKSVNSSREFKHVFILYDSDGLKNIHAEKGMEKWIGTPINKVPCPMNCCNSLSEHFSKPYLEAIEELGIDCKIFRTSDLYSSGKFDFYIKTAIEKAYRINEILGRQINESPFIPLCPICEKYCYRSLMKNEITCKNCQNSFLLSDFENRGKLKWEVEWAALWSMFNAAIEPIGSVHTSLKGSTYEKASDISDMVFEYQPPEPIEFGSVSVFDISCKHMREAQCCKRNITITYQDWKKIAPPEILRFLMIRENLNRQVEINIEQYLVEYYSDFYRLENEYEKSDANQILYNLSLCNFHNGKILPSEFLKIVTLTTKPILKKDTTINTTQSSVLFKYNLDDMFNFSNCWLGTWHVENIETITMRERFQLLNPVEKSAFQEFCKHIKSKSIIDSAKDIAVNYETSISNVFRFIYWVLLQKTSGPPIHKILPTIEMSNFDILN